jgi:hypothetical protein
MQNEKEIRKELRRNKKSLKQTEGTLNDEDFNIITGWVEALNFVLSSEKPKLQKPPKIVAQKAKEEAQYAYDGNGLRHLNGGFAFEKLEYIAVEPEGRIFGYSIQFGVQCGGDGDWSTKETVEIKENGERVN